MDTSNGCCPNQTDSLRVTMVDKKIVPVHYTLLIRVFEMDGYHVARQKGDHIVMIKPGAKRPLVIKTSPRLVPVTHIRTNMSSAGMSRQRYFELLDQLK